MTDARVVEARDVWRSYSEDQGVRALDLTVPYGTLFALVGPSGSGKTTTVRLLLGVERPDQGELTVLGTDPWRFTRHDRERIGYLPQLPALYPELSIGHNLQLMASLYGLPWRARLLPGRRRNRARRRIRDVLDVVGLSERRRTRLANASGGEQRRLGLAAAIVHEPEFLVLDEPTAGIDPLLRRRIWDHLAELRRDGTTVFVTTQYVTEAEHCDLVAFIVEGRIVAVDSPERLRRKALGADADRGTFDDVFVALVRHHDSQVADGA